MLKAILTTVAYQARCTVVSEAHRCEVSERPICGKPHTKVSKTLSVGTVSRIYHHRTLERFGREIQCLFRAIHFCPKIVLLKNCILHNSFNKGFLINLLIFAASLYHLRHYSSKQRFQNFHCKDTTSNTPLSIPFCIL